MILHADIDAFYASVAQRDDPSLRGKPIVVSGRSRRAVVLTASYEARPFGVRSAMPLFQALERCPQLLVVPPDFERYRDASRAVFAIFREHATSVEGLSMDEAYLDVGEISVDDARSIGAKIKAAARAATGLTVSIGIASGKAVAKIASDDGKPDGLVVVEPGTEAAYLAPKSVSRLPGIGPKTTARLSSLGIERVDQIADMDDERLFDVFGRWGNVVRDLARGLDHRRVSVDHSVRLISSEETFENDVSAFSAIGPVIRAQAAELAGRLQKKGLCASTVGVKIKLADFTITGKQTRLANPTDDHRIIGHAAAYCFRNAGVSGRPIRLIGVRVSSLGRRFARQLSIFGGPAGVIENSSQ